MEWETKRKRRSIADFDEWHDRKLGISKAQSRSLNMTKKARAYNISYEEASERIGELYKIKQNWPKAGPMIRAYNDKWGANLKYSDGDINWELDNLYDTQAKYTRKKKSGISKRAQEKPKEVNPEDASFYDHTYEVILGMGFSGAKYRIYADNEQEALDILFDWLEENEPGWFLEEEEVKTDFTDEDGNEFDVVRAGNASRAMYVEDIRSIRRIS